MNAFPCLSFHFQNSGSHDDAGMVTAGMAPFGEGFVREANVLEPKCRTDFDFVVPRAALRISASLDAESQMLLVSIPAFRVTSTGELYFFPESRALSR